MNMNFTKFPAPVLGNDTHKLYVKLYGDVGENFIDVLNTSPNEIAIISRMIAYLKDMKGATSHGSTEDS